MIIGNHQAGLTSEILCMYKFWWKFDVWDLPISLDSRLRPTLLFAYLMCDRKHTISTLSVFSHLNMNKMRSQVINETTTTTISFFHKLWYIFLCFLVKEILISFIATHYRQHVAYRIDCKVYTPQRASHLTLLSKKGKK